MNKAKTTNQLNHIDRLADSDPQKAMSQLDQDNKDPLFKVHDLTFIHNETDLKLYKKPEYIAELNDCINNPKSNVADVANAKQFKRAVKPLNSWIRVGKNGQPRDLESRDIYNMTDKMRHELKLPSRADQFKQIHKKLKFNIDPKTVGNTARNLSKSVSSKLKRPFCTHSTNHVSMMKPHIKRGLRRMHLLKQKQDLHR